VKLKNFFLINFKKPVLEGEEEKAYNRKHRFLENLSKAYSRLETIEICNSNSKYEDSKILSQILVIDIINLVFEFYSLPKINKLEEAESLISKVPIIEVQDLLKKLLKLDLESVEEDESLNREETLTKVLSGLEKHILKKHKTELANPVDEFKTRLTVQAIFFSILFLFSAYKGVEWFIKTRPLKGGMSYMEVAAKINNKVEILKKENPYTPSENWTTLFQVLEDEYPIEYISISPIQEPKARVQIRNLKLYDKNDKLVFEAPLIITENFFEKAIGFLGSENLKPGQYKIGRALEFETLGPSSQIRFHWKNLVKVKKITWEVRMIKNYKKFND
jgi:hypothetical protein